MDPIAVWTLVFTVIGAVAAIAAAYYSKRGPTKKDFERVERNTAETAKQVEAVRQHSAQMRARLALQGQEEASAKRAALVSMTAQASGYDDQPLSMKFTLKDPEVKLVQIEMVNGHELPLGTLKCVEETPQNFSVNIDPRALGRWINESDTNGGITRRLLRIRAHLDIDGAISQKGFAVNADTGSQPKSPDVGVFSNFINVHGGC